MLKASLLIITTVTKKRKGRTIKKSIALIFTAIFSCFALLQAVSGQEKGWRWRLNQEAERAYADSEYETAVNLWQELLKGQQSNVFSEEQLAQIHSNLATTFFKIGRYKEAIEHWKKDIEFYEASPSDRYKELLTRKYVDRSRAYLALGQIELAEIGLKDSLELLAKLGTGSPPQNEVRAAAYLMLGNISLLEAEYEEAKTRFYQSLEYAFSSQEKAMAWTNLSKLYSLRSENPLKSRQLQADLGLNQPRRDRHLALDASLRAADYSKDLRSSVRFEVLLQLLSLSPAQSEIEVSDYLKKAEKILEEMPSSTRKVNGFINLSQYQKTPVASLKLAANIAREIKDARSASFAGVAGLRYDYRTCLAIATL